MLDSRLQSFFNDCQIKLEALGKEVAALKRENTELEVLVSENERENKNIKFRKDKIQINFDHLCNLDNDLKDQVRRLKEQITKAHNDLCSITKAHQQQRVSIAQAESELQTSIHTLSCLKKTRVSSFSVTSKLLDDKTNELKSLISSKDHQNTSARLELLEKDLKDSYRVSSILDLQRKFSSSQKLIN